MISVGSNEATSTILNTAIAALQNTDANSAYCDHLLAELRELSPQNSRKLRQILSRTMWEFLEKNEDESVEIEEGIVKDLFE